MEQKAKICKSALQIMVFCILASKGCSFIGYLLSSSKKKKTSMLLNQILKEKRFSKSIIEEKKVLKPSKNIVEEKIVKVVKPSKSINVDLPSKNIIEDKIVKVVKPSKCINVDRAMKIHFPEEIIDDILSRLPVRSLLRFKCASKFWKSLISDPHFKTKHWNHAKNNKKFQKLLIGQLFHSAYDKPVSTISFYCSSLSSAQDVQKLGRPLNDKPRNYIMLCCCDGFSLLWSHGDHLLWNPSTNESALLPNPEVRPYCPTYGMGYDSTIDDYKIFQIDNDKSHLPYPSSKILALKSGSWRKIDKHPRAVRYCVSGKTSLAFVHGAFHWICRDFFYNLFMVSFNISNEVYGEIPLPEGLCSISKMGCGIHDVSILDEMLCACCNYINAGLGTFKLWVMKDYGVKESWTELFTIQGTHLGLAVPMYRFADGEVLLYYQEGGYQGFKTSKGPFGLSPAYLTLQYGYIFTESLISPKSKITYV